MEDTSLGGPLNHGRAYRDTQTLGWTALCILLSLVVLGLCSCTATSTASESLSSTPSQESTPLEESSATGENQTTANEEGSEEATDASSSAAGSTSASSTAGASASAASAASASSASASAGTIIASPELLTPESTSAQSSPESVNPNQETYAFTGTYRGILSANDSYEDSYGEAFSASESDQIVALGQRGGTLLLYDGRLSKPSGDSADEDDARDYGTNSVVLAVNEATRLLLGSIAADSDATGANGFFATDKGTLLVNEGTFLGKKDNSRGFHSTFGGTIVASGMGIETSGNRSSALSTGTGGGNLSIANCTVATAGEESPIIHCTGRIEADNILGSAGASSLVRIHGLNDVLLHGSRLSSTLTADAANDPQANAIILYRSVSADIDPASEEYALFQSEDSSLTSTIQTGSLFYLTNTQAKVVLKNTDIIFDSEKAKLITAEGNTKEWGSTGRNGANATFTGQGQKLKGDIEADALSSLDLFLLDQSSWEGSASVLPSSTGSATANNISINVDSTSRWTVTANSTVSNLNLSLGAKLVDRQGNSVKIIDGNGFTLVDGASSISVSVTGSFSTTVKTSASNQLESPTLDRTDFDQVFGTATAWGTNGSSALTDDEKRLLAFKEAVQAWFSRL